MALKKYYELLVIIIKNEITSNICGEEEAPVNNAVH